MCARPFPVSGGSAGEKIGANRMTVGEARVTPSVSPPPQMVFAAHAKFCATAHPLKRKLKPSVSMQDIQEVPWISSSF